MNQETLQSSNVAIHCGSPPASVLRKIHKTRLHEVLQFALTRKPRRCAVSLRSTVHCSLFHTRNCRLLQAFSSRHRPHDAPQLPATGIVRRACHGALAWLTSALGHFGASQTDKRFMSKSLADRFLPFLRPLLPSVSLANPNLIMYPQPSLEPQLALRW